MELNNEQIGANVAAQLDKLYEKRKKLEMRVKNELTSVNAEITALERLAGLRKKPGKPKGVTKSKEKSTIDYIAIAKSVLEAHEGEALTSSEITQIAINTGLWSNPPKSAKANMGRILSNANTEEAGIWRTDDKKFFIPVSE